jgi:hypothetical protein
MPDTAKGANLSDPPHFNGSAIVFSALSGFLQQRSGDSWQLTTRVTVFLNGSCHHRSISLNEGTIDIELAAPLNRASRKTVTFLFFLWR